MKLLSTKYWWFSAIWWGSRKRLQIKLLFYFYDSGQSFLVWHFSFWYWIITVPKKLQGAVGYGMVSNESDPTSFGLYPTSIPPRVIVQNCRFDKSGNHYHYYCNYWVVWVCWTLTLWHVVVRRPETRPRIDPSTSSAGSHLVTIC